MSDAMTGPHVADQRSSLLDQLRVDRSEEPATARPRLWLIAAAAAAIVIGVAAWLLLARAPERSAGVTTAQVASAAATVGTVAPSAPSPASVSTLDASGYVVARHQATVSAKITGKVTAVLIEEGQRVETGQIVARLDDTNARAQLEQAEALLEQQRAALAAAIVALRDAEPGYERHREQFRRGFSSAQDLDAVKTAYDSTSASATVAARAVEVAEANVTLAQRALDDTVVRAPFAGIVTVKAAQEGEMVSPMSAGGGFTRTGIGTIVDMDSIEVEVDVSESFINRVQAGGRVAITLNAYPQDRAGGHVIAIIPTADRAKATVKVRVGFDARDERVLPEMGARVAFLAPETGQSQDDTHALGAEPVASR
jgi:RND family efflux transporter MFP subunit